MDPKNDTAHNILAEQIITHPNDAILFVGYSDPETPAGKIKATQPGEMVNLRAKGGQAYPLNCRVECFNFSGHATRQALIEYARSLNPKKVLLVHGDQPALDSLSEALREVMPDSEIIVPEPGKPVRLD